MRLANLPVVALNLVHIAARRLARRWRGFDRSAQRRIRQAKRLQEQATRTASLQSVAGSMRAASERLQRRAARFQEHVVVPWRVEREVKRALARAAAGSDPIIVGPWTSEVGYEALYWIPFLHWFADRYGIPSSRVVAISRGGVQAWYRGIADRYVEIFDLMDAASFSAHASARRESGDQKQIVLSAFEQDVARQACARIGVPHAHVCHPGLMYRLFRSFWHDDRALDYLFRHTRYDRVRLKGFVEPPPGLPVEYAAVKFYTGPALGDSAETRQALRAIIARVAARMPIVVLDTGLAVDEHRDVLFDGIPGVTTLPALRKPSTNLGLQTAVIAGARLFVGTCGGLAWLAPLLGVDTLAIYEDDRYLAAHLYAARHAYRRTGAARFITMDVHALRRLDLHARGRVANLFARETA
jgi:hypothetical protein